jgi:Domain of unknown function (DUF4286)
MIIYNVTTKLSWQINEAWLQWMKQEHINDVIATGCFTHAQLLHLIEADDEEGPTYATQYFALKKTDYEKYIEVYADELRKKTFTKWGDKFISFRTVMQIVQ